MSYFSQIVILALAFVVTSKAYGGGDFDLFLETGAVWQNRNDTQIPPNTGTRFAIDELNSGPFFHFRIEGYYRLNQKHGLRFVYAPSEIEVSGKIDSNVVFNGQTFTSAEDLDIRYQFNSYRLTYLYAFEGFGKDQINAGITAKVRDAETTFRQTSVRSTYDNVGFVPLIYFEYQKALGNNWKLNFTLDGAAASQGRAFDAALKARRDLGKESSLGLGIRTLEGGADNDKVFTFSWFNYALLEFKVGF